MNLTIEYGTPEIGAQGKENNFEFKIMNLEQRMNYIICVVHLQIHQLKFKIKKNLGVRVGLWHM